MMGKVFGFATRSSKQKTSQSWALQKSGDSPIITLSALLKLAEWWESRVNLAQGEGSCLDKDVHPLPRPAAKGIVLLDQLWTQLAPERRQQVVHILACVVARQIVPLPGKEADDEC